MPKRPKIVILGSMIYDCVAWAERLPQKGETVKGHKSGYFCGGKGANQAVQAAKLGAEVYMISKVGEDKEGEILLDNLKRNGVNIDHVIVDRSFRTDMCCIHVDNNGDNTIVIDIQSGENITIEEINQAKNIIKDCDIFLTQLETHIDTVAHTIFLAKGYEKTVILNPAPAFELPKSIYKSIDYLTPNETEAEFLTGIRMKDKDLGDWTKEVYKDFQNKGVKNIIVTLSSKGAFCGTKDMYEYVQPFVVDAVDATGAGDAFNAALAVKISQGEGIRNAVKYANAVGAVAASREGAQSSFGSAYEIDHFLYSQNKRRRSVSNGQS